jgi:hypothetical protein
LLGYHDRHIDDMMVGVKYCNTYNKAVQKNWFFGCLFLCLTVNAFSGFLCLFFWTLQIPLAPQRILVKNLL